MNTYTFTVKVECDTPEQAQQVMIERTYFDEPLGFEYKIDFEPWTYEVVVDDPIESNTNRLLKVSRADVYAARTQVDLDQKAGKESEPWVIQLSQVKLSGE